MTNQTFMEAIEYLTIKNNGQSRRVVDIGLLRMNHSNQEIIEFLKGYMREKEKSLRDMILTDKSHPQIDEIVAAMFRLHMAIRSLENGSSIYLDRREVRKVVRFKQGTKESGELHEGNSCGHSVSRFRKNKDHDGTDKYSGDETRSIA